MVRDIMKLEPKADEGPIELPPDQVQASHSPVMQTAQHQVNAPVDLPVQQKASETPGTRDIIKMEPAVDAKEEKLPTDYENMEWKQVFLEGMGNAGGAVNFTQGIIDAFLHPIKSGKAIGELALGAGQKVLGKSQGAVDYEKNFDALIDMYKKRYGTIAGFKEALATDGLGVLGDASMIIAPGLGVTAKALQTASKADKLKFLANAADKVKKASKVVAHADPTQIVSGATKLATKGAFKSFPEWLYKNGAKFSAELPKDVKNKLASTGMRYGIPLSVPGAEKLHSVITETGKKVDEIFATESPSKLNYISVDQVFRGLDELKYDSTFKSNYGVDAINKVVESTKKNILSRGKHSLTAEDAVRTKQGIYQELNTKFEEKHMDVVSQARRDIANNLRVDANEIYPQLKKINDKDSDLRALRAAIIDRVNKLQLSSTLGYVTKSSPLALAIGPAIKATGAGYDASMIGAAVGVIGIGIISDPMVQSKIAILLDKVRMAGGHIDPNSMAAKTLFKYDEANKATKAAQGVYTGVYQPGLKTAEKSLTPLSVPERMGIEEAPQEEVPTGVGAALIGGEGVQDNMGGSAMLNTVEKGPQYGSALAP